VAECRSHSATRSVTLQLRMPVTITEVHRHLLPNHLTERFRALGRAGHGGMPEVLGLIARRAERLLTVSASDEVLYHSSTGSEPRWPRFEPANAKGI
jgi:hypothetical protein